MLLKICLFSKTNTRPKLKVLHVRDTGLLVLDRSAISDKCYPKCISRSTRVNMWRSRASLRKFADWAFGPEGLPNLEVFAFGDLTYENRFPNLILCRSDNATHIAKQNGYYRANVPRVCASTRCTLTRNIEPAWRICEANRDMLEACAEDTIIDTPF